MRSQHTTFWLVVLVAVAGFVPDAVAKEETDQAEPAEDPGMRIEIHAELQNVFLYRNDTDFDRTSPLYDPDGQTVGALATIFTPKLTWHLTRNLRIYYEAEIGLNYWSRNNPDEESGLSSEFFVMKHREIWGEGEFFDGQFGFKVGYQRFQDPTGLFVDHWIGALQLWYSWAPGERVGLFVGEVPDQVYEGIDIRENNFKRDILVMGARADVGLYEGLSLSLGLHGLYDSHIVGKTRWLVAPNLRFHATAGPFTGYVDGVLQYGRFENATLGGGDQTTLAWAAQAHAELDFHPFVIEFNLVALSPDDAHDGNGTNGAFLYSAKPSSTTIMLTEDETRDWYDNFDERMSLYRGGFFLNRAGLVLGDVKASWEVADFFRPALIVGAAAVLEPDNALGNRFVGVEADLDLEFRYKQLLVVHLVGGALVPGAAGGSLVNRMGPFSSIQTDPVYMAEVSLALMY